MKRVRYSPGKYPKALGLHLQFAETPGVCDCLLLIDKSNCLSDISALFFLAGSAAVLARLYYSQTHVEKHILNFATPEKITPL